MYVCMFVCLYVCMYVCMCVYAFMYVCMYACMHACQEYECLWLCSLVLAHESLVIHVHNFARDYVDDCVVCIAQVKDYKMIVDATSLRKEERLKLMSLLGLRWDESAPPSASRVVFKKSPNVRDYELLDYT